LKRVFFLHFGLSLVNLLSPNHKAELDRMVAQKSMALIITFYFSPSGSASNVTLSLAFTPARGALMKLTQFTYYSRSPIAKLTKISYLNAFPIGLNLV